MSCPRQNSKNNGLGLLFKNYIIKFNLFPVICCYRWQGWKRIETWKRWANLFKFWCYLNKNLQKPYYRLLFCKTLDIHLTDYQEHFVQKKEGKINPKRQNRRNIAALNTNPRYKKTVGLSKQSVISFQTLIRQHLNSKSIFK